MIGRVPFRDCSKRNVPVSDHANQPVIFADRKRSAVDLLHESGCLFNGIVRRYEQYVSAHNFANLHAVLLLGLASSGYSWPCWIHYPEDSTQWDAVGDMRGQALDTNPNS